MSEKLTARDVVSITQLESKKRGPIWVLNTTVAPTRSNLVFGVPSTTGGITTLIIPATFLAMNLTDQAPKLAILNSESFRRAVYKKLLVPVTEEYAAKTQTLAGAREEMERLRNFASSSNTPAMGLSEVQGGENVEEWKVGLSPTVVTMIELMRDTAETDVLNTARNLGELHRREYRAIARKAKELEYKTVRRWARGNMETTA